MEGKIFDFNPEAGSGLIRADDGNRYEFALDQFRSQGKPRGGMTVDFDVVEGKAHGIYCISGGGAAAFGGKLKGVGGAVQNADIPGKLKRAFARFNRGRLTGKTPPVLPTHDPDFVIGDNDETVIWSEPPTLEAPPLAVSFQGSFVGVAVSLLGIAALFAPFANFAGIFREGVLLIGTVSLIDGNWGTGLFLLIALIGVIHFFDLNPLVEKIAATLIFLILVFRCFEIYLTLSTAYANLAATGEGGQGFWGLLLDRLGFGFYLAVITSLALLVGALTPKRKGVGSR